MLLNQGFTRVTSLRGGVQVWQAAGLAFVAGP
jgi:rhodanese-related sulfurtransferase